MNHLLIPARGGSKGIPHKNIAIFLSRPLISYVIVESQRAGITPWVATDADEIADIALQEGARIYWRSPESATDTAPTEHVLLDWIRGTRMESEDIVILAQATSPYTCAGDIIGVIGLMQIYDSVLTAQRTHRFFWSEAENGEAFPINYLVHSRPRRQDNAGVLMENGALYASRAKNIIESGCRISGKIGIWEMGYGFELDSPEDWKIGEVIMGR